MTTKTQETRDISLISEKNIEHMSALQLEELLKYMAGLRTVLMEKMEIVHARKEVKEKQAERLAKLAALSPADREALKQDLNGDHFKEPGKTESGSSDR
jgi:hypothetical protein